MNRFVLVSDFDGTITRHDFYQLVAREYMPPEAPDYFARYAAGEMTHFEAMAAIFAFAPEEDGRLADLLRRVEPDPDLRAGAECLERGGWDLVVVSAGSSWYIERILDAAGVHATVHANPGRIQQGRGLALGLPRDSPFFCPEVGIDKAAVVRDALRRYERVAFAGDGPPDVKPALLVDPALRFARGYLARELAARGEAFRRYGRWFEIVEHLAGGCEGQ